MHKKERRKYYEQLDLNKVTDEKELWKTIKPFLSDKVTTFSKISFSQNEDIILVGSEVANMFNSFFENAVSLLGNKKEEQCY